MRVMLHQVHCLAKTESDQDEIYCVVSIDDLEARPALVDVGKFDIGTNIRPDVLLSSDTNESVVTITFMESDANEPDHGRDDFIGEISVTENGDCTAGRCTLDEGLDESKQYRQFSMTGSAANYVVQFSIQP